MQLFACLGEKVLYTLTPQELPLELLDMRPYNKNGYAIKVETPDGKLHAVETYKVPTLTTDSGLQLQLR